MSHLVAEPAFLLPISVALPFVAALLVLLVGRPLGRHAGWLVLLGALGAVWTLSTLALDHGSIRSFDQPWLPAIQVAFALRGDAFGLFLGLLVAGVGALVALYSLGYMADEPADRLRRYYAALGAFMGAMLGIALSDDLILLFVFWEITSISSFLLIGFRFEEERAKAGALMALQVTALGGLVMSVGFLLVGQITGTFSISAISGSPELIAKLLSSPLSTAALLLVLGGAFTKSAQFPFHFWLPRAMVAPTPVSAYLHAATMVKAGVFLLGRMLPIFGGSPLWAPILVSVGTVTMALGAYQALRETDLKAILARTTGSTLGLITLLYGLGAADQDALQILNHALYKGALFLVAGIVEHHTHTRDLRKLGGLARELPLAFAACLVAALSMAGVPPLLGFLAKESTAAAVLYSPLLVPYPLLRALLIAMILLSAAMIVAVAAKLVIGPFLGERPKRDSHEHQENDRHGEAPTLWLPPAILAALALALGLGGLSDATGELAGALSSRLDAHLHLSLLPEAGLPLYLSIAALALGAAIYRARARVAAFQERISVLPAADALWERLLGGIVASGESLSRRWQNGSLRWYLTASVLTVPLATAYAAGAFGLSYRDIALSLAEAPWYGILLCILLGAATLIAAGARTRLQAAIATSTIGFLVSMLFVVYRSPDILLTQILIETVSTIFVLLVLIFLPAFPKQDLPRSSRVINFAVATAFSLAITVLMLLSMTPGLRESDNISNRPGGLLSLSLAEGGGANAVNVIIVDIRAMDTNGEIAVLVVVGLCVYALLRTRRNAT